MKKYSIKTYFKFEEWFLKLDRQIRSLILERIYRIESGNLGDYKSVGAGVFELRIFLKSGYRIYFAFMDNVLILLISGGSKDTQEKDIKKAKQYWQEIKKERIEK